MSKKQLSLLASYVIGAFITNSYCRNCRWDEWKGQTPTAETHPDSYSRQVAIEHHGMRAFFGTFGATIFWPIYAASRACDAGVSYASNIELKWK